MPLLGMNDDDVNDDDAMHDDVNDDDAMHDDVNDDDYVPNQT